MRQVFSDPSAAAQKGAIGRQHIQQHFDREVVAEVVMNRIRQIKEKLSAAD
jgi:hypothetical protein